MPIGGKLPNFNNIPRPQTSTVTFGVKDLGDIPDDPSFIRRFEKGSNRTSSEALLSETIATAFSDDEVIISGRRKARVPLAIRLRHIPLGIKPSVELNNEDSFKNEPEASREVRTLKNPERRNGKKIRFKPYLIMGEEWNLIQENHEE